MKRILIAAGVGALLLVASYAAAQFRGGRNFGRAPRFATAADFDGGFQFCRVAFRQSSNGDGAGWDVDYPRADYNLSVRISELSRIPVSMDHSNDPKYLLVRLGDTEFFRCGALMMTEPGGVYWDEEEVKNLHTYLQKGGFLWADDFWGEYAWAYWESQIHRVLPSGQYPIVDLGRDHVLFHQLLDATKVPQIPGIGYWDGGDRTWERPDARELHIRAINDDHGRIMVLMTHNTDFGDAYERETENPQYFMKFSVPGYAFGINAYVYAMTH